MTTHRRVSAPDEFADLSTVKPLHMLSAPEAFAEGVESERKRRKERDEYSFETYTNRMEALIRGTHAATPEAPRGSWPGFKRAVEHIVTDDDAALAAIPHGVVDMPTYALELATTWMQAALRCTTYTNMIEATAGSGFPTLPKMTILPTAGAQGGEKTEAYSRAFSIEPDSAAAKVDSSLYLNISDVITDSGGLPVAQAVMLSAVANEANNQIVAAIESAATQAADINAGFAAFDGSRFTPSVVVIPPGQTLAVDTAKMVNAGLRIVLDASATKTLILSPDAVVGWFRRLYSESVEPSVYGRAVGYLIAGRVSVEPSGVAAVTAAA